MPSKMTWKRGTNERHPRFVIHFIILHLQISSDFQKSRFLIVRLWCELNQRQSIFFLSCSFFCQWIFIWLGNLRRARNCHCTSGRGLNVLQNCQSNVTIVSLWQLWRQASSGKYCLLQACHHPPQNLPLAQICWRSKWLYLIIQSNINKGCLHILEQLFQVVLMFWPFDIRASS